MFCEECLEDKEQYIDMKLVFSIETGNCDSGCCPVSKSLYQCPHCKTVTEDKD